jgi:hypothetical protein
MISVRYQSIIWFIFVWSFLSLFRVYSLEDIGGEVELSSIAAENGPRRPGTLLLNMLTKNEREHLDRTLPAWAKIIDYWIIGLDETNTDDSEEVIKRHLGHLPGHTVVVSF